MIRQQVFQGPAFRQDSWVPDFQAVFIDPDLHGRADGVVPMHQGVQDRLAQSCIGHRVAFDALDALIGDSGLEILGPNQVDGCGGLLEEVAMHLIMVCQVGGRAEIANLHKGTGHKALRVIVEEE